MQDLILRRSAGFFPLMAVLSVTFFITQCEPAETDSTQETSLVIMSSTDLHGYVRAWDYYRDDEGLAYSMSRVATMVDSVRNEHEHTMLLDAGDWLQGNAFAEYFSRDEAGGRQYPLLTTADYMDYDAFVLGNHEFDYGLDYLHDQIDQTETPVIGANMYEYGTQQPAYQPYVIREMGELTVAVLGLNTPGTAVWNRPRVEGEIDFHDGTEVAQRFVPKLKDEYGADVVVVLAHSGYDGGDSYTDEDVPEENFGESIAEQVDGIDAMVLGHRHRTFELVRENVSGSPLGVIESGRWGDHLGEIELTITHHEDGTAEVTDAETRMTSTSHAEEHTGIVDLVDEAHSDVRNYVNQTVATTPDRWSTEEARTQNTAAIDLIHQVQLDVTGAQLSAAAAFNTGVEFGPGDIRLGDIALLYLYENTLYKMELSGGQIRDFLEHTSQYYLQPEEEGELNYNPEWPGFNFDMLEGLEYELDLRNPVGERVTKLEYEGAPVQDDETFTVAINSYRAEGGGGFDMLADAERLETFDYSVRDMIIDYLRDKGEITASDVKNDNWRLVY